MPSKIASKEHNYNSFSSNRFLFVKTFQYVPNTLCFQICPIVLKVSQMCRPNVQTKAFVCSVLKSTVFLFLTPTTRHAGNRWSPRSTLSHIANVWKYMNALIVAMGCHTNGIFVTRNDFQSDGNKPFPKPVLTHQQRNREGHTWCTLNSFHI